MVSGNMPAFSAYPTSGTSTSTGTWTKITFDSENFDTNNNFASSRFTPTVAGYYQITGNVRYNAITASAIYSGIYKNGSLFCQSGTGGATAYVSVSVSSIVYLNGSTDYVEIYGYQNSGLTVSTDAQVYVVFSGVLVRTA
jgi:hypothetical protein